MTLHWIAIPLLALAMAPGLVCADAEPELAVIVNKANPVDNLSQNQLRLMLLGQLRRFPGPDRRQLVLAQRDPESEVYRLMLLRVLRMNPAEYKRYLMAVEFRGDEPVLVKTLNSDDTAAKYVFNVPNAVAVIAAVPASGAAKLVKIVRIDGKMPGEPGYGL